MAFIPSYWRETPQRYRYEGNKCTKCKCTSAHCKCDCEGTIYFPPRLTCCPWCECKMEPITLATEGKVKTYTIIHIAPPGFGDETPYALAVLEMSDGARLTAQVVDVPLEKMKVGLKVRLEFRKLQKDSHHGILQYGYKAVPT